VSDFAARISRVRLKGGPDVRVLHRGEPNPGGEDWRGIMVRHAREIAEKGTDEAPLAGFVVLGIFADGTTSLGYRYDVHQRLSIPRALIPAWIAEIIRRDIITNIEARDVFDEKFEWVENP
jgi:hypothetical protein